MRIDHTLVDLGHVPTVARGKSHPRGRLEGSEVLLNLQRQFSRRYQHERGWTLTLHWSRMSVCMEDSRQHEGQRSGSKSGEKWDWKDWKDWLDWIGGLGLKSV